MKTKLLLTLSVLLLAFSNIIKAQSVSVLPGESTSANTAFSAAFTGDFNVNNTSGGHETFCTFNQAKGMLSIGLQTQSDGTETWNDCRVSFYWGGTWYTIFGLSETGGSPGVYYQSASSFSATPNSPGSGKYIIDGHMATFTVSSNPGKNYNVICGDNFRSNNAKIGIYNYGNLQRYNGNYNPVGGDVTTLNSTTDVSNFSIQTLAYASNQFYPLSAGAQSGNPTVAAGMNLNHVVNYGTLPGFCAVYLDGTHSSIVINITNLPPAMLESPSFRVHLYAVGNNANDNYLYETVYNNTNFMNSPPTSLTASTDKCGKVVLNWSNGHNTLPTDGTVHQKTAIFKNGTYLDTVGYSTTTYTDNSVAQDVTYNYSLRHVTFSESSQTYYQTELGSQVQGSVLPSPPQPISPTASIDKCTNKIDLGWSTNGANPTYFRIDTSRNAAGPFGVLTNTISGASRSYAHTGVTRGIQYYYNMYSISTCSVVSTTAATCNGISPSDPNMATGITATTNTVTNSINVAWTDNATNETKYEIVRTDDQGNTVLTQINANATSYSDNSVAGCRLYTYKVRVYNDCVLSGITSTSYSQATLPPPNLGSTFDATHKLTASKGYFSNRVELSWGNNNSINIDYFKIYRKQLGSALDSVQIATATTGSALYVDNTADARVLYRYTIVGIKNCNGAELLTNISSDNGFRNPTGQISGHIEYNGGVAVKNVKVIVQNSANNLEGNSLDFSTTGTVTISDNANMEPGAKMRLEFWVKPSAVSGYVFNKNSAYNFGINGANWQAQIYIGATAITTTMASTVLPNNQWNHVSMVYDGSYFRLFANGLIKDSTAATGSIDDNANNLVFGGATSAFKLDEFRLLGAAANNATILNENSRILFGNETAFRCNLHFDEAFGNYVYDVSQASNVFNANHGLLSTSNVIWSSDIPINSQLGYFGITDSLGNYSAAGIRYQGSGENFNLVPNFQTHSFTPNSRSLFIGDGSNVFGNQDFTDNSSFLFSGTLYYKGCSCPVPNAGLKIDGLPVIANGAQATSNDSGKFSISVPIGNHYVSIELFGHDMDSARYPMTGVANFQAPVNGVTFTDSTKRVLVGRVVGGLIEANKAPGMGRSKNNIGKAFIRLISPPTATPGNICLTETVVTTDSSGEYILRVPPLAYGIESAYVVTNSVIITNANNSHVLSNSHQQIDLTNSLTKIKVIDTLFAAHHAFSSVDSITYNRRLDMVYRITPTIDIKRARDGFRFIGEDSISEGATKYSIKPTGPAGWGAFGLPVFMQRNKYAAKIYASEIYTNTDNNAKDTVKLSGDVYVTNDLVDGTDPNSHLKLDSSGSITYSFTCGSPNIATNAANHLLDYAKEIQINVVPTGAASVVWLPNATNATYSLATSNYYAYVVGQKITGTGIATLGPEKIDYILRDPPGSGSSATWVAGQALSTQTELSIGVSSEEETSDKVSVGTKEEIGLGVATEVEVETTPSIGMKTETSANLGTSFGETITSTYGVSTRDDAGNVGAPADIFIGRSRNWLVGPTANIELQTVAQCTVSGQCFGAVVNGYQLASVPGYAIAPADVKTRFSYTQDEIENTVIPSLQGIRNSILNGSGAYTSIISSMDPRYASNNDDPVWNLTGNDPTVYDKVDTTGSSYTFRGRYLLKEDTVRTINNQIALWKQALARNEKEKIACLNHTPGYQLLDNFTLGSAIVSNSYEIDDQTQVTESFELSLSETEGIALEAKFNGTGVSVETNLTLKATTGGTNSNSTTNTDNFSYTLTDGDPGDIMSVDVYKTSTGNVFITRGGQTMCPYEDAVVCHYYNPSNPTAFISSHAYNATGYLTIANATVQREDPHISITPAIQLNIPSGQAASYQLTLTNQSALTINNDIDLRVYVAATHNPNGAILKIDGQNADATFTIPTGGSVVKTLTVERGPIEINYDSLMIVFASACSGDIADTAYISVHFIPTCTDLSFNSPVNNFVINNSNNNLQNVIVSNYNYNYGVAANTDITTNSLHPNFGFEKMGFELKPGNGSTWTQIQDFSKTPTGQQLPLPNGQVYTQYSWSVTPANYPDGNYELRSVSYCYNKDGSYATVTSPVIDGVMDRINPGPFGTPSPGDGILDPNDDISIQFNEPIDGSSLSYAPGVNFDIRGVINGTTIRHSESLNFDGTSNYAEVIGGVSIQKRSFSFEFWAKINTLGINQTVISQGTDATQNLVIGFDNNNKFKFSLGNQTVLSTSNVSNDGLWHHYAVVYDYANHDASLYTDGTPNGVNNNFLIDYTGSGKLEFGKELPSNLNFFTGNMHEVRLWNRALTLADITTTMNIILNQNQAGLLYNWKMDEATGAVSADGIRSRNADIHGATWEVNPNGNAAQFDGTSGNIQISSGTIAINKEMDFTLEFWFNSAQSGVATLFANGKGDGVGSDSLNAWNIQKDASGIIHAYHDGLDFVTTSTNYFDGTWHHFALVMQRSANLSAYVDGNLQNSVQATSFNNLSGAFMYLGARGYQNGPSISYDNFFNGKMDEFRLWNTARKAEQIQRDKQNRMLGNEYALMAFEPFEHYTTVLGTPSLTATFNDQSVNSLTVTPQGGVLSITQTPTIKLPRPIQAVNYVYSLNNDKIILTTTTDPALLENVTLDITVKNAYDMHGNIMQSPKTWIAYINKNQVKWQDAEFDFTKKVDSVITFTAPIVNSGGAQKSFTIAGLPSWLTANITSGTIAPNSTQNIVFTIPAGGSIGDFSADISLTTNFNYAELLRVNLNVHAVAPTWTVNPANFQYSMSIFGQLKIDNVISTNVNNKIAAFNNQGVICGVANLQYLAAYDRYEVFLSTYSNSVYGDSLKFKIYDAGSGLTFVNVTPSLIFTENDVVGTISNPITFSAFTEIALSIPLNNGWTWASFPLQTTQLKNSNSLMSNFHATTNDVAWSSIAFDEYDNSLGWMGNISSGAGYQNNQSYKIKTSNKDTVLLIGSRINPDSSIAIINVNPGWNWIGYVSTKNTPIATALGNYNASTGDLLKSQYQFAYYDNLLGWTGSLTTMYPAMGYMLKSATTTSFSYPLSSFYGRYAYTPNTDGSVSGVSQNIYPFSPYQYQQTMSAIVKGNICDDAIQNGNVALGAFDANNVLRGYAYPINVSNTYLYYLTLYSNVNSEALKLAYFNSVSGEKVTTPNVIIFNTEALVGTPSNPIMANVVDSLSCVWKDNSTTGIATYGQNSATVYPNPFENNVTLQFNQAVTCHIEVMDVLGKVVLVTEIKDKKETLLMLDGLTNGMYQIRLSGGINQQIKIVKTK